MVNQFVHGIQDRLVKIDVKKYVANMKDQPTFCVKDVLQVAQNYAEQHEEDINYFKSYKISWNLVNGINELKLSVAYINLKKMIPISSKTFKGNRRHDLNDRQKLFTRTYKENQRHDVNDRQKLCYKCHKPGHLPLDCEINNKQHRIPNINSCRRPFEQTSQYKQRVTWPYDLKYYQSYTNNTTKNNRSRNPMNIYSLHSKKINNFCNISLYQSQDHYCRNFNERQTKKVKNDRDYVKINPKIVVQSKNTECHEITVSLSINDQISTAYIDTGSPVTVVNKRLYDRMRNKFDGDSSIITTLIKPSVSLYSSELVSEISTLGECDVK